MTDTRTEPSAAHAAPTPPPRPVKEPLAIVGVGCLFPGSLDESGFWRDIVAGKDLLSDVPPSHWLIDDYYDPDPKALDKTYARRGGFLPDVVFDPIAWGVPPNIVPATDTSQLLALIVAQRVLDQATQGNFATADKERTSVILGVTSAQELLLDMTSRLQRPIWVKALREIGLPESEVQAACDRIAASYTPWQEASFPGLLGNVVAGRVANRLDLHGTNCVVDAACASSLSAVAMAAQELWLGDSDLVVAGGVETLNDIFMYVCFSKTPALSATGDCRPFSDRADGTMLGEGLGMVALKRLSDAQRDGDKIYCTLEGIGSSSDGRAKSIYAPVSDGQARALDRAYDNAGYSPTTVELVEAHGTGTKAGDAAEINGLKLAFGEREDGRKQWVALGSVKSQIGHTKAAAGAAGLFKVALALHQKVLPPTIKVDAPNPKLNLPASPFYLNTEARPWIRSSEHPRRASVSAFGFGGSNFHATLQEYVEADAVPPLKRGFRAELLAFSGAAGASVIAQLDAAIAALGSGGDSDDGNLLWQAYSSAQRFDGAHPLRVAVVADTAAGAVTKLQQARQHLITHKDATTCPQLIAPNGVFVGAGALVGDIAFLMPGQGSQRTGMGADLAMAFGVARAVWDRADDLVREDAAALSRLVFPPPTFTAEAAAADQAALTQTQWAQPALGACSLAATQVLRAFGVAAKHVAGHSFGEISALWAADVLSTDAALAVAQQRGERMAAAADKPGAMVACKTDRGTAEGLAAKVGGVTVANHNAPDQVVLSGGEGAIERLVEIAKAAGISARKLPVATAFHSSIVADAEQPFAQWLASVPFSTPNVAVYSNTAAAAYPGGDDAARALLSGQISRQVRFVEMIEAMYAAGARTFVEVGAGAVLTGLTKRILGDRTHRALTVDRKGKNGVEALWLALGELIAAGAPVQLSAAWQGYETPVDPTSIVRPKLAMTINGANYGKPYPPANGAAGLPAPNPERQPVRTHSTAAVDRSHVASIQEHPMAPKPVAAAAVTTPASETTPLSSTSNPAMSSSEASQWIAVFAQAQQQTAAAHTAWQQTMADAHMQFLRTSEQAMNGLQALVTGQPVAVAPPTRIVAPPPQVPAAPAFVAAPPVFAPVPAAFVPAPAAAPVAAAAPANEDPEVALLAVVAEKTGYPADMLELSMQLEADLGIDSIKRVEILAALSDRLPSMPEIDASEAAELQTLGAIVARIGGAQRQDGATEGPNSTPQGPINGAPSVDLRAELLAVVADKTGYPAEMLELNMELEADLGIDSIKRVEILAALQDRVPSLPETDSTVMSELRTLGAILDSLQSVRGNGAREPSDSDSEGDLPGWQTVPDRDCVGRYVLERRPSVAPGLALAGLFDGCPIAVVGRSALADALTAGLQRRGFTASPHSECPPNAAAVIAVSVDESSVSQDPLTADSLAASVDRGLAAQRNVFAAARTFANGPGRDGGAFVVVSAGGGDFGTADPWSGGTTGLVRTAALEWPKSHVKGVDVALVAGAEADVAAQVIDELVTGGAELLVGRSPRGRIILRDVAAPAVVDLQPLPDGTFVVASGGARGVTAACLLALARHSQSAGRRLRVALLGRSALVDEPSECAGITEESDLKRALMVAAKSRGTTIAPAEVGRTVRRVLAVREVLATLASLRAAGAEVEYVTADVCDLAAVAAGLDALRPRWGGVGAIVHGAGVLADRHIAAQTDDEFSRVIGTKIGGLCTLLTATAQDQISHVALFSSVAARAGNTGQVAYAMANETLNRIASLLAERDGVRAVALGWGPWAGGMVDAALARHFEAAGIALIPLQAGADAFVTEWLQVSGPSDVVLGGAPRIDGLGGADGLASPRPADASVVISQHEHPHLVDHVVGSAPVVPVALAVDWLTRSAAAHQPDLRVAEVRDLRVFKGIELTDWRSAPMVVRLRANTLSNGHGAQVSLRMTDAADRPRYGATVVMTGLATIDAKPPAAPAETVLSGGDWKPCVYAGAMFHGPAFQVIADVMWAGSKPIACRCQSARTASWADVSDSGACREKPVDPVVFEAAMQMGVLYADAELGGAALPTAVDRIRVFPSSSTSSEPARVDVVRVAVNEAHLELDLVCSRGGAVTMTIERLAMHVRPATAAARSSVASGTSGTPT